MGEEAICRSCDSDPCTLTPESLWVQATVGSQKRSQRVSWPRGAQGGGLGLGGAGALRQASPPGLGAPVFTRLYTVTAR